MQNTLTPHKSTASSIVTGMGPNNINLNINNDGNILFESTPKTAITPIEGLDQKKTFKIHQNMNQNPTTPSSHHP